MSSASDVLLQYVCPSLGCIMASVMFAAPVQDLRDSLIKGNLGDLNPFPFTMMTGNCLGWTVYGYYTRDPFVVAANLPGLVLSLWLNIGAAKLQYFDLRRNNLQHPARRRIELQQESWDASPEQDGVAAIDDALTVRRNSQEDFVMVPQERALLRILCLWIIVIVYVGWFSPSTDQTNIVGVVVNINLVFFYGAPLQTMCTVISERSSASIHVPTMVMNWMNTSFWIAYGLARNNLVIVIPNSVGLFLGILQGLLRLSYPTTASPSSPSTRHDLLPQEDIDGGVIPGPDRESDGSPEDTDPASSPLSYPLRRRSADDDSEQTREVV